MTQEQCPNSNPNSAQHSALQLMGRVHSARALRTHDACRCALLREPGRVATRAPGDHARPAGHDTLSQVATPRRPGHVATPNCGSRHRSGSPFSLCVTTAIVGCNTMKANYVATPRTVSRPQSFQARSRHQKVCCDTTPPVPGRALAQAM